ncbi:MAG: AsnC family protein [Clostridium sp.]|uniref:helix-turn-helix transcriptional regulator n=1 Tax=Clostridium sp. TaxID=1506 RepID=UPI0025C2EA56|nr:AsnC family protein [Clostridium sp.]MCE5222551.1 AsnC family protein [Clostridium sp.]
MANRPKMKTIQNELNQLKETVKDHEQRLKNAEEREIVRMLQETNKPGSSKPRYTYKEIAEDVGVSPSTVNNIAAKNNLSRRNIG